MKVILKAQGSSFPKSNESSSKESSVPSSAGMLAGLALLKQGMDRVRQ